MQNKHLADDPQWHVGAITDMSDADFWECVKEANEVINEAVSHG